MNQLKPEDHLNYIPYSDSNSEEYQTLFAAQEKFQEQESALPIFQDDMDIGVAIANQGCKEMHERTHVFVPGFGYKLK